MKYRRLLLQGLGLAVLGGAGLFTYKIINQPATGTVHQAPVKPAVAVTNQLTTYNGQYASYRYPSVFTTQPHPDSAAPVLDRQWFARGNLTGWQLSVTIYDLPSEQAADNGDYNLRLSRPERFQKTTQMVDDGREVVIFSDSEATSFNKVAFIQAGRTMGAVSLLGAAGQSDKELTETLTLIVDSWRFNR